MGTRLDGFPDTWLQDDLIDSIDPFCSLEEPPENGENPDDSGDFITADAVQVKVEVSPTCPYCYNQFPDQLSLEEHVELCPKSIPDDQGIFIEEPKSEDDPIKIDLDELPPAVTSTKNNNVGMEVLRKPIILPQNTRKYTCKLCSAKFRYSHHLTRHQKVHSLSSDRPHKCNYCSASFISSYQLTRHKLIHGAGAVMSSSVNPIILKNNSSSKSAVEVTELKFQFCELCLTGFSNRKNYDIHKKIHIGQKLYKCGECSAAWKTKEELMGHMRRHTASSANTSANTLTTTTTIPKLPPGISISPITKMVPKKVSRPIPGSIPISFLTPSSSNSSSSIIRYKTIMNSPMNNNRLKTQVSKKSAVQHQFSLTSSSIINSKTNSSSSGDNRNRIRKPSGKGKFVCEVCGHNFQRGHHLTRHRLIHTGERPHKCHMCPKSYSRKEHLTAHLKTHDAADQTDFVTENLSDQAPRVVELVQSNSILYDEEDEDPEEATEIMGI